MQLSDLFVSHKQVDPVKFDRDEPTLPQPIYLNLDRAKKVTSEDSTADTSVEEEDMSTWNAERDSDYSSWKVGNSSNTSDYNTGDSNVIGGDVAKYLDAGDMVKLRDSLKINTAGGQYNAGLDARRRRERALFDS